MRERAGVFVVVTVGALAMACAPGLVADVAAQDPLRPAVRAQRPRPGQAGAAAGQGQEAGQGRAAGSQAADRLELAELQRLFDAYLIVQAQDALQLDDVQFGQFLPKLKGLQDTRRRNEQARHQLVVELARLTAGTGATDETTLRDRLRALQELEGRAAAEIRRAYDTLDQQLDVRRQARFRVFEQNMERRKFQLMLRARRSDASRLAPGRRP